MCQLINVINRKERCNAYITYAGMLVTVLVIALVYWWRFGGSSTPTAPSS